MATRPPLSPSPSLLHKCTLSRAGREQPLGAQNSNSQRIRQHNFGACPSAYRRTWVSRQCTVLRRSVCSATIDPMCQFLRAKRKLGLRDSALALWPKVYDPRDQSGLVPSQIGQKGHRLPFPSPGLHHRSPPSSSLSLPLPLCFSKFSFSLFLSLSPSYSLFPSVSFCFPISLSLFLYI